MKISVFGKSGPRLVTTGLVCASAAVGPAAIQPAAASTTKNPRILLDISTLPALVLFCDSLSRRAALSRYLGRPGPAPRGMSLCTGETRGYLVAWAMPRPSARIGGRIKLAVEPIIPATNRSNCHVDAKCGLSCDYP